MQQSVATFDAFVDLIAQIVSIDSPPSTWSLDTELAGELMLDSISLISLLALSEERFGISLAEHADAVAALRTIGDALDLIERLDAAQG